MTLTPKRGVTQEELEALYATLPPEARGLAVQSGAPASHDEAETDVRPSFAEIFGVHIQEDRTVIVALSKKGRVIREVPINIGYRDIEGLAEGIEGAVSALRKKKSKVSMILTLTGRPAPFLTLRLPRMGRQLLLKAMRIQMKSAFPEEATDVQFLPMLTATKLGEAQTSYLVGCVEKGLLDTLSGILRKMKFKLVAFDLDIPCYVRAANLLWNQFDDPEGTRFLVLLQWESCYLLIVGPDGRVFCPKLPIGVRSFFEHLKTSRSAVVPRAVDARDWRVLPTDPIDVRERKLLARQAIHEVYTPLAQQVKTQLYTGCNEHGIPLPTQFIVVAPGKELFHIEESLAADLGLTPLPIEGAINAESIAALGAGLWERETFRLNFSRHGNELVTNIRELWVAVKQKVALAGAEGEGRSQVFALVGIPLIICLVLSAYPLYRRWSVTRLLDASRAELASLAPEKDRIAKAKEREAQHDRRRGLAKMIEKRGMKLSTGIHELFSALPSDVRLTSIGFKDGILSVKGLSKNPISLESFLRDALKFKALYEPTPLGIKREKAETEFEITFRFRPTT